MFVVLAYMSGSILFARVFARWFHCEEELEQSKDGNPGTANAFHSGGFWCGMLTLVFDLFKGFFPVYLYIQWKGDATYPMWLTALVLAAPVFGHAFPIFYRFKGGKGIAVTFGSLLGVLPYWKPVVILAFFFILFSVVLRISPHLYRTMAAYGCSLMYMLLSEPRIAVTWGFLLITMVVMVRLCISREQRERLRVHLLWKL